MTEQLPSKSDNLFGESDDWWNNACLNFTHDGLYLYAYGYKDAADLLANSVIESGQKNDILIHPIAFCYRHYLELSFKAIHTRCHRLLGIVPEDQLTHQIDKLWAVCVPLVEQVTQGKDLDSLKLVSHLIEEFTRIDPFATAFRYPEDKKGNKSLAGLSVFNIRNLRDVMAKIDVVVHGVLSEIHEYQSIKDEIERSNY